MRKVGYCRVYTKEQNLDRQISAMRKEGVEEQNIYADHMLGKDFARPQYKKN